MLQRKLGLFKLQQLTNSEKNLSDVTLKLIIPRTATNIEKQSYFN